MAIIRENLKRVDTRIIRPSEMKAIENPLDKLDEDEIPFVPAYDLLEKARNEISDEEAAAIGVALIELTPDEHAPSESTWGLHSRLEAISRRF